MDIFSTETKVKQQSPLAHSSLQIDTRSPKEASQNRRKPRITERSAEKQKEASGNWKKPRGTKESQGTKISFGEQKNPREQKETSRNREEASETLSGSDVRDSPGGFGLSRLHLDSKSLKISERRKLELSVNRSISRGTKLYELSFQGQQSPPAPSLMEFCLSTTCLIRFSLQFFILESYINRLFKLLTSSVK